MLRRIADHHLHGRRLDDQLHSRVIVRQQFDRERERDVLAFARCEMHAPETTQFLHRSREAGAVGTCVELHHLVTGAVARVHHLDGDLHDAIHRHPRRCDGQVLEGKGRVAQSKAKGEERFVALVHVRTEEERAHPRWPVCIEDRHLADVAREGDRQLAAGVGVGDEELGQRRCAFRAGQPRLEYGRYCLHQCRDRIGAARHQHEHHGRAGGDDCLDQRRLDAGQRQVRAVAKFARRAVRGEARLVAHHDDRHLGLARSLHGGGKTVGRG